MILFTTRLRVLGYSLLDKEIREEYLVSMDSAMTHKECKLVCLIKRYLPFIDFTMIIWSLMSFLSSVYNSILFHFV